MTIGFLFWLCMILLLLFGGWGGYAWGAGNYPLFGGGLLLYVLLFLLGVKCFGWPIQG